MADLGPGWEQFTQQAETPVPPLRPRAPWSVVVVAVLLVAQAALAVAAVLVAGSHLDVLMAPPPGTAPPANAAETAKVVLGLKVVGGVMAGGYAAALLALAWLNLRGSRAAWCASMVLGVLALCCFRPGGGVQDVAEADGMPQLYHTFYTVAPGVALGMYLAVLVLLAIPATVTYSLKGLVKVVPPPDAEGAPHEDSQPDADPLRD